MTNFVICIEGFTIDDQRKLANALELPLGWWHRLENLWLISDLNDQLTARELRAMVQGINPKALSVIFEVEIKDWAARLKTGDLAETSNWFRQHFGPQNTSTNFLVLPHS